MQGSDGKADQTMITCLELVEPERLVCKQGGANDVTTGVRP
jgi:hypothetical protein